MKKALFIDRDGTIIKEPVIDEQVDSLEKLEFCPGAITALGRIAALDFELVMATNQDGLGTASFPTEAFTAPQEKMLSTLEGEGIRFDDMLIDPSRPEEGSPNRKPGTGMFGKYLSGDYDLAGSFVIGDRITDMQLAANLGSKGILYRPEAEGKAMVAKSGVKPEVVALITDDWNKIWAFLRMGERTASVERKTKETDIKLFLDLDGDMAGGAGSGSKVSTGLKFFDHMLDQIAHHSGIRMEVEVKGDLEVDEHHTIEDTGIAFGEALRKALGDKRGIGRYGFALPMDECSATVLLDLGGRIEFVWGVEFGREMVGDVPTEMFSHFFKSFAQAARCSLHISATGDNEHHKIEGVFKAFARALRMAVERNPFKYELPSSKGVL